MFLPLLIAAVVGYLLGSLPFGYLVARAHGVDIFKAGSGNPSATNVKRVLGSRAGNTVYFLDALKGAVAAGWPVVWCFMVHRRGDVDGDGISDAYIWGIPGLVAAVVGHSFSIFTHFKGGKGVATASGGLFVLMPVSGLIAVLIWLVTFLLSRYVSLASILASLSVLASAWWLRLPLALEVVATVLSLLVVVRHHSNLRRLIAGTEHRWERKRPGGDP